MSDEMKLLKETEQYLAKAALATRLAAYEFRYARLRLEGKDDSSEEVTHCLGLIEAYKGMLHG